MIGAVLVAADSSRKDYDNHRRLTSITAMSIVIRTFQRVPAPTIAKASVVATR